MRIVDEVKAYILATGIERKQLDQQIREYIM